MTEVPQFHSVTCSRGNMNSSPLRRRAGGADAYYWALVTRLWLWTLCFQQRCRLPRTRTCRCVHCNALETIARRIPPQNRLSIFSFSDRVQTSSSFHRDQFCQDGCHLRLMKVVVPFAYPSKLNRLRTCCGPSEKVVCICNRYPVFCRLISLAF